MSELYFYLLPIDIIKIILYHLPIDDFSSLSLNFNDYISREFLINRYPRFYAKYKEIKGEVSMRLNKLLSMYSYYINLSRPFNKKQCIYNKTPIKGALDKIRNKYPLWMETFSAILIVIFFPKMYQKIDEIIRNIFVDPHYNILNLCFDINSNWDRYHNIYNDYINKGIVDNDYILDLSDLKCDYKKYNNYHYDWNEWYSNITYYNPKIILFLMILDVKRKGFDINIKRNNELFSLLKFKPFYEENFHLVMGLFI